MKDFFAYIRGQLRSREMWARFHELNSHAYTREERTARRNRAMGKGDFVPLTLTCLPFVLLFISIGLAAYSLALCLTGAALSGGLMLFLFMTSARLKD